MRVNSLLVGETEASGFKSEYQNYLKHSDVGHEFGYNSVALGAEESRVYRNEKEVYDAGEDGAQTINHRLPRQLFQGICHNESKNSYFCQIIVILSKAKELCKGLIKVKNMKRIVLILAAAMAIASCACRNESEQAAETQTEMEKTLIAEPEFEMVTSHGTMKLKLYSMTPKHRDNFVKLVNEKYYDGMRFHRVIEGFMIQGGDPYSRDTSKINLWGQGGPDYTVPAEFVNQYWHKKGAIAAARKGDMANPTKASSGSQFYIVHDENNCLHLDGQYSIFGEVTEGLEVIDRIAAVPTDAYDRPYEDVMIISVKPLNVEPEEVPAETADTTKTE